MKKTSSRIRSDTNFNPGTYLLLPPTLLWIGMSLLMLDKSLAEYVVGKVDINLLSMIYFIAGLIFPGTALAMSAISIKNKVEESSNTWIRAISIAYLILLAVVLLVA